MSEKYEIEYTEHGPVQKNAPGFLVAEKPPAPLAAAHPMPYRPPLRLPAIANTAMTILAAGVLFFGAERFAPHAYKPSTLLGSYEATVNEQLKAAELNEAARFAEYEATLKLAVDTQAKQTEMLLQAILKNYEALYDRNKLIAETAMRMQSQYYASRVELQKELQSGSVAVVTGATLLGQILNGVAPGSGDNALRYADAVSKDVVGRFEEAARSGAQFKLNDWDLRTVPPEAVKQQILSLPSLRIPEPPPLSRHYGARPPVPPVANSER